MVLFTVRFRCQNAGRQRANMNSYKYFLLDKATLVLGFEFFPQSISLWLRGTNETKHGHNFSLLDAPNSLPLVKKHRGCDDITTDSSCRPWKVLIWNFIRAYMASTTYLRYKKQAVSYGPWIMCCSRRGVTSEY